MLSPVTPTPLGRACEELEPARPRSVDLLPKLGASLLLLVAVKTVAGSWQVTELNDTLVTLAGMWLAQVLYHLGYVERVVVWAGRHNRRWLGLWPLLTFAVIFGIISGVRFLALVVTRAF